VSADARPAMLIGVSEAALPRMTLDEFWDWQDCQDIR